MSLQLYLGRVAVDGTLTNLSQAVLSPAAHFTAADIGRGIDILKAGADGVTLTATITAVSGDTATISYPSRADLTNAKITVYVPFDTSRGSITYNKSLTSQDSASFSGDSGRNTMVPVVGMPVLLVDSVYGDAFGGPISEVRKAHQGAGITTLYECQCASWDVLPSRHGTGQPNDVSGNPLHGKFSGLAAGGVFDWICRNTALEGDISNVSVVTGPTIDEISFDFTDDASALDQVCTGASDDTHTYIRRTDARRNMFFELQTTSPAPWSATNADVLTGYTVTRTDEKYANVATVTPKDSTGDTIDSTLVVTFQNDAAVDERSAVEGGTGRHEVIVSAGDSNRSMGAATLAESIAKTYGVMPEIVEYETYRGGLRPGHLQTITLTKQPTVSGSYLIDSVSMSTENGKPRYQVHAVSGALIGDWRTAFADLAANRAGYSSVSGGVNNSFYTDAIVAGHVSPDLANGFSHQFFLVDGTPVAVDNPIYTGGSIAVDQTLTLSVYQDTTGSRPDPTFDTEYVGTSGTAIGADPLTVSTYYFRFDGAAWNLVGFSAGGSTGGSAVTPPALPTSVTWADHPSERTADPISRAVLSPSYGTITLPTGHGAEWVHAWFVDASGATQDYGDYDVGAPIKIWRYPGETDITGNVVKVTTGKTGAENPPSTAVASDPFTISAIAPPGALGTTLTIPAGAGGTWPYDATLPNGHHYWVIPSYSWDDTPRDSSAFVYRVTAEDLGVGGVSVRAEEPTSGTMLSPTGTVQTASLEGEYGRAGNGANRTADIEAVKLRLYACSRVDQSGNAFSNALASTLLDTKVITVAAGAAIPVDLVDMTAADPTTWGENIAPDADGKPVYLGDGDNLILNGNFDRTDKAGWGTRYGLLNIYPYAGAMTQPNIAQIFESSSGGFAGIYETASHPCRPGDQIYTAAYFAGAADNSGTLYYEVWWYDSAVNVWSAALSASTVATRSGSTPVWTKLSGVVTAPAGAAAWRIVFSIGGLGTAQCWNVDNVFASRQVTTGAGTGPDGFGGVKVLTGPGITTDGSGNVVIKTATTSPITTDGSGNVVVKLQNHLTADASGYIGAKLAGNGVTVDGSGNIVVKNGGSITFDGSGNVIVGAGPGLTFNGGGQLVPNQGATVGVNGSGQLVVPASSLGLAEFGGVYQPYAIYFGLPAIGSTVPKFIVNTATTPWSTWRQDNGAWRAVLDSRDIVANSIVALASISSPAISGGSMVGASYTMTSGTRTVTIDGTNAIHVYDSAADVDTFINSAGILVRKVSNSAIYTAIGPNLVRLSDGSHVKDLTAWP